MKHDLIKTGDPDSFAQIQDRNGEVALSYCRRCRKGEGELGPSCTVTLVRWSGPLYVETVDQQWQIGRLLRLIGKETLDPMFEKYDAYQGIVSGSFAEALGRLDLVGARHYWGNFYNYSHSFDVITDDQELITKFDVAIRENLSTAAYKEARDVRKQQAREKLEREAELAARRR